mgnify:CR=1 FL=1
MTTYILDTETTGLIEPHMTEGAESQALQPSKKNQLGVYGNITYL